MLQLNKIKNNLIEIIINSKVFYFSYNTCIAIKDENTICLTDQQYSKTTEGHKTLIKNNNQNKIILHASIEELTI